MKSTSSYFHLQFAELILKQSLINTPPLPPSFAAVISSLRMCLANITDMGKEQCLCGHGNRS